MENVSNAILNLFLVSIPEQTFQVIMILLFLKRFDLLDLRMWRQNLKVIMIPVLPTVLLINILKYILMTPIQVVTTLSFLTMTIFMIYFVFKNSYDINFKLFIKIVVFTFLTFAMVGLLESLYVPLILYLLDKPISFFNNNIFYNFLLALPGRIFEYCLITYILIKQNNSIKTELFNTIFKNRFLLSSFIMLIICCNIFVVFFMKLIVFDNILVNIAFSEQLAMILVSVSFPIISITWFLLIVNYILTQQKHIQQAYKNLLAEDDFLPDVEE